MTDEGSVAPGESTPSSPPAGAGRPDAAAGTGGTDHEEIQVEGKSLGAKVKELIQEGNVRRIAVKNAAGNRVLEIPVTAGIIGTIALPAVAAVGAIAGLANNWTLEIYRRPSADDATE